MWRVCSGLSTTNHLVGFDGNHDGFYQVVVKSSSDALEPDSKPLTIRLPVTLSDRIDNITT